MQLLWETRECCGPAKSPLLRPEVAHLNQKPGSGGCSGHSQQAHVQPRTSSLCRELGEGVGSVWTTAECFS